MIDVAAAAADAPMTCYILTHTHTYCQAPTVGYTASHEALQKWKLSDILGHIRDPQRISFIYPLPPYHFNPTASEAAL